ncbi:MAG: pectate lyase [Bacteroidetes bacterium]|nr:pectate lyase [Bacteroidota bacterium]
MQFLLALKARLRLAATIVLVLCESIAFAQKNAKDSARFLSVDAGIFDDASHHWYGIADPHNIINANPGQQRYRPAQLAEIADNILLFQKDNGGWPKNYDMLAVLTPEQKEAVARAKNQTNTTFDNRTTWSQIATLARVYYTIKDDRYKDAALKGLDFIMKAQYDNGGWPQYYPLENGYSRHITFNDDAYIGIMKLLKDIVDGKPEYAFIDPKRKERLQKSFDKGVSCILKTQINDAGHPTAWCQQYDEKTLEPAWARKFEPPSICDGESVGIVLFLMSIKNPSPEIKAAIENAIAWFNASRIEGIRVKTVAAPELPTPYRVSKTDRVVVADSSAPPIWTRYYELKTHRPLFCNRDSKVVYSLAEVDRERRDGYAWYTYAPQDALSKYPDWQKKQGR